MGELLGKWGARGRPPRFCYPDFELLNLSTNAKKFVIGHRNATRVYKELLAAIKTVTTPKQYEYMMLYYGDKYTMPEIAEKFGVNKSTVYRTIKRGVERCRRKMVIL